MRSRGSKKGRKGKHERDHEERRKETEDDSVTKKKKECGKQGMDVK